MLVFSTGRMLLTGKRKYSEITCPRTLSTMNTTWIDLNEIQFEYYLFYTHKVSKQMELNKNRNHNSYKGKCFNWFAICSFILTSIVWLDVRIR